MHRITPTHARPLHDTAATRALETGAQGTHAPHALMQRAGLAVAQLALAAAPHARRVWLACGPGNNGGDGLEAAMHLQRWGRAPVVTWLGNETSTPSDARAALTRARDAGVLFAGEPPQDLTAQDLCVDALLGIGSRRPPEGAVAACVDALNTLTPPVLAVDVPTGLNADTGDTRGPHVLARWTLSLLTLKPGLFTAHGRDAAGQVWLDPLGVDASQIAPSAWMAGPPAALNRRHASHKGSYGDVAVIGGAPGMTGAAQLAARAALHGGAGRVFLGLLDSASAAYDPAQPELMLRDWQTLDLKGVTVVCGCGGGDAVRHVLAPVLSGAGKLVLDAHALNALATDTQLQALLRTREQRYPHATLITPHPLEAARLLGCGTADVQADRLKAAQQLARQLGCTVILKGSGSVLAQPGHAPWINPTGNPLLATAGTGDVLAGLAGALLASGARAFDAATQAAWRHGQAADQWPAGQALTASALAARL
ncbi:MAG: NAD(P)H-hydrate dehydratase [Ramlibacter sp.]